MKIRQIGLEDTDPDTQRIQAEILGRMTPHQKLELVAQSIALGHELALAGLRQRFPGATAEEIERRCRDLMLGPELARAAYGRPPYEPEP